MQEAGWLLDLAVLLRRPVCELIETVPAQEMAMWRQYMQMEPRGDRRADWHAGQVAKAAHDVAFAIGGKSNPAGLETYLLKWKLVDPESTQRELLMAARGIFGNVVPIPMVRT